MARLSLGARLLRLVQAGRRALPERYGLHAGLPGTGALLAIVVSLTWLALSHNLDDTVILDLAVVAVGAIVTSRRSAAALVAVSLLAWILVVTWAGPYDDPRPRAALHLGLAVALAVVLHEVRGAAERRLRGARDDLAVTAARFRSLFDGSPVGVGLADDQGSYVAVNPAFCAIAGRPAEALIGASSLGYTHPDDVAAHHAAERRRRESPDGQWRLEKRLVRPDGSVRWIAMDAAVLDGPDHAGWQIVHMQDITGRREAQVEEERLRALLASAERLASTGSWEWEPATGAVVWSDEIFRLIGAEPGEVPPSLDAYLAAVHPEDRELVRDGFRDALRHHRGSRLSYRLQVAGPGGELVTRHIEGISQVMVGDASNARPVPGSSSGSAVVLRGSVQDVTERVVAEQALRDREADLAAIARAVRLIHSGDDAREGILAAAQDLVGATDVVLLESDGEGLVVTASQPMRHVGTRLSLQASTRTAQVWRSGEQVFLPDAAAVPGVSQRLLDIVGATSVLWQSVPAPDGSAVPVALLVLTWRHRFDSLDERMRSSVALLAEEAAIALQRQQVLHTLTLEASTDPLTGLPNRRTWEDLLGRALEQARRQAQPVTVALADLDHFKAFNDEHGHTGGDDLLRVFATSGRAALRERDVFARWGGEEFALVLPECDEAAARAVLERFRAATPGGQTISVGAAVWDGAETAAELLVRADAALYAAKASGRDRLVQSGSSPGEVAAGPLLRRVPLPMSPLTP